DDAAVIDRDAELDPAVLGRVLRRVVQHIAENLAEPRVVTEYPDRRLGHVHDECMALGVDERANGLDAVRYDAPELYGLAIEVDLTERDSGYIEQIVDEPRKMIDLPLDDLANPDDTRVARRDLAEHLRGRCDRCERIAQLVRKHRQEFVLAPIGFLELFLGGLRARHLAL